MQSHRALTTHDCNRRSGPTGTRARAPISLIVAIGLLALWTGMALASDGQLEINDACALAGCFAGDTAGYPVAITTPGSYRLTGNLAPTGGADAISVDAEDVSLDLGGFRVIGNGSGTGIAADAADYLSVRNGTVRSFEFGLDVGGHFRLEDLTVRNCTSDGVSGNGGGGDVRSSRILDNGGAGLVISADSLYRENQIKGNSPDVSGGTSIAGNHCSDGSCSPRLRRRLFYLTQAGYVGGQPDEPGVCDAGFHFAQLFEIADPSALEYDTSRGRTSAPSGEGPPSANGWIRTGNDVPSDSASAGEGNCNDWSSSAPTTRGTIIGLADSNVDGPAEEFAPWRVSTTVCLVNPGAWCIED